MSDFDYSYKAANAIMESFENLKKLELDIEADHVNKSFKSTQTELQNLNKILQNDPFEALNNINQLNATIQEKLNQKNMYGQNYVIREDHTRKYLENTSNVLNSLSSSITKAQNFKDELDITFEALRDNAEKVSEGDFTGVDNAQEMLNNLYKMNEQHADAIYSWATQSQKQLYNQGREWNNYHQMAREFERYDSDPETPGVQAKAPATIYLPNPYDRKNPIPVNIDNIYEETYGKLKPFEQMFEGALRVGDEDSRTGLNTQTNENYIHRAWNQFSYQDGPNPENEKSIRKEYLNRVPDYSDMVEEMQGEMLDIKDQVLESLEALKTTGKIDEGSDLQRWLDISEVMAAGELNKNAPGFRDLPEDVQNFLESMTASDFYNSPYIGDIRMPIDGTNQNFRDVMAASILNSISMAGGYDPSYWYGDIMKDANGDIIYDTNPKSETYGEPMMEVSFAQPGIVQRYKDEYYTNIGKDYMAETVKSDQEALNNFFLESIDKDSDDADQIYTSSFAQTIKDKTGKQGLRKIYDPNLKTGNNLISVKEGLFQIEDILHDYFVDIMGTTEYEGYMGDQFWQSDLMKPNKNIISSNFMPSPMELESHNRWSNFINGLMNEMISGNKGRFEELRSQVTGEGAFDIGEFKIPFTESYRWGPGWGEGGKEKNTWRAVQDLMKQHQKLYAYIYQNPHPEAPNFAAQMDIVSGDVLEKREKILQDEGLFGKNMVKALIKEGWSVDDILRIDKHGYYHKAYDDIMSNYNDRMEVINRNNPFPDPMLMTK